MSSISLSQCPLAPQAGISLSMHIPTVLAHGRGCKLVFNKDYTGQRLESLLLSGLGQSSLNRMDRDTGCCVGSSSCTLASHQPQAVATAQLLSLLRTTSGGPGQGWQDFSSSGRGHWMRPRAQHLGTLVAVERALSMRWHQAA